MIKGRYVAQIEIDFEKLDLKKMTLGEVRERLRGEWMPKAVAEAVGGIFHASDADITVTTQYADVYEVTEE